MEATTMWGSDGRSAVRGIEVGREGWTGTPRGRGLATGLGWFSLALGAAELVAPDQIGRMIGLAPGDTSRAIIRAMGVREIGAGLGVLANPGSKEWLGLRIDGDLLDLALLAAALLKAEHPERTLVAAAAVMGVSALDVIGAEELNRARKAPSAEVAEQPGAYVHKSVTIGRPREDVYAFWRDFPNLPRFMEHLESVEMLGPDRSRWTARGMGGKTVSWEAETTEDVPGERIAWRSVGRSELYNAGTVRFRDAPAGRGTEVAVEMWYAPPGGALATALLRLFRKEARQQVADDLRRLKQVMELGEIVAVGPEEAA
jgi:uncharacterized membrane protein